VSRFRVAVLSDIHGFSLALETVMADLERRGPFEQVVVAGDLCEVGPDPWGVIELLQELPWTVIQGNTDRDLVEASTFGANPPSIAFTLETIGEEGIDFLNGLPFSHRIAPPGRASGGSDLLVVHANPRNQVEKLDPEMSDDELRETIGSEPFGALAFGHLHVCYTRQLDGALLIDVSAVGNPKDGDLRCKYGIVEWDDAAERWRGELIKLPYPLEETAEQIYASGLPDPDKTLRKLRKASY
jgi:predicted phosphodiesterase